MRNVRKPRKRRYKKGLLRKKVTSSHVKNKTVVIAEDNVDTEAIANAVRSVGYTVGEVFVKPYKKRGLLGIFNRD